MPTVTYEAPGMMEWHPVIKIGHTYLQIPFTGGHFCGGASSSATFETSDEILQRIIQNSPLYLAKRIRIRKATT